MNTHRNAQQVTILHYATVDAKRPTHYAGRLILVDAETRKALVYAPDLPSRNPEAPAAPVWLPLGNVQPLSVPDDVARAVNNYPAAIEALRLANLALGELVRDDGEPRPPGFDDEILTACLAITDALRAAGDDGEANAAASASPTSRPLPDKPRRYVGPALLGCAALVLAGLACLA